jgi:hypothetical protein
VARIGESRSTCRILLGRPEGKILLGNLGADGRIILKWIFKKWYGEAWTGMVWLRKSQVYWCFNLQC